MDDDYATYMGDNIEQNDAPAPPTNHDDLPNNKNDENDCQSDIFYKWFRNGEAISKTNDSNFEIFCNGSIKIKHSSMATAIYRCLASTKYSEIGAILSKSSNVQAAG